MKKAISLAIIFAAILSISYTFAQTKTVVTHRKAVTKTTTIVKKASAADIEAGQALISKADCLACHKLDVKLVGPAYKDVAKKYPATATNYDKLVKKVISGGSGVWGPVAMAPHPALKPADAKKMIEYVLSLK
jgi:cytochrome c